MDQIRRAKKAFTLTTLVWAAATIGGFVYLFGLNRITIQWLSRWLVIEGVALLVQGLACLNMARKFRGQRYLHLGQACILVAMLSFVEAAVLSF